MSCRQNIYYNIQYCTRDTISRNTVLFRSQYFRLVSLNEPQRPFSPNRPFCKIFKMFSIKPFLRNYIAFDCIMCFAVQVLNETNCVLYFRIFVSLAVTVRLNFNDETRFGSEGSNSGVSIRKNAHQSPMMYIIHRYFICQGIYLLLRTYLSLYYTFTHNVLNQQVVCIQI